MSVRFTTISDLVRQRVYGIACGYPDGNDAAELAPILFTSSLLGRDPVGRRRPGFPADV